MPDEDFAVWPENWDAVQVFLAMSTQWRFAVGMGNAIWQGLDYTALPVVERRLGIRDRADCFARLRVIEAAAVRARNEAN